jgi:hypothetical protein
MDKVIKAEEIMAQNTNTKIVYGTGGADVTYISAGVVRNGLSFECEVSKAKYNSLAHFTQKTKTVSNDRGFCQ